MKYVVYDSDGEDVSVESRDDSVVLHAGGTDHWFTRDEFREFRKAVGYVWQEVEQG